jgi:hypothetical protein
MRLGKHLRHGSPFLFVVLAGILSSSILSSERIKMYMHAIKIVAPVIGGKNNRPKCLSEKILNLMDQL